MFDQWDTNGDGVLSLQEITSALRNESTASMQLQNVERRNVSEYLKQVYFSDANLDWHEIDFDEFESLCVGRT